MSEDSTPDDGNTFVVEADPEIGFVTDLVPEFVQELAWGELVSRGTVEAEIDTMLRAIRAAAELLRDSSEANTKRSFIVRSGRASRSNTG